jgi:hypothetical protein
VVIGIFEISRINTPRAIMSRISDRGASRFCLVQYLIDLAFAGCKVPEAELCGAWNAQWVARILSKLASRIKRKDKTTLQVKHHYGSRGMLIASLELVAGNTLRRQAEAVTIKRKRPIQIVDPKSDNANLRLHDSPICGAMI